MPLPLPSASNDYTVLADHEQDVAFWQAILTELHGRLTAIEATASEWNDALATQATAIAQDTFDNSISPQLQQLLDDMSALQTAIGLAQDQLAALQAGGVDATKVPVASYGLIGSNKNAQEAFQILVDAIQIASRADAEAGIGTGHMTAERTSQAIDAQVVPPDLNPFRANIALAMFKIEEQGGLAVQKMIDGFTDTFTDESGIDGGASTGQTYQPDNGCYASYELSSMNLVPVMTSNTMPSGEVTASEGGTFAWRAFDGTDDKWAINNTDGVLTYEFPTEQEVFGYSIASGDTSRSPRNWTFKGWNGASWDVLDTVNNVTVWSASETKEFPLDAIARYAKFALDITDNNGAAYLQIEELELYGANTYDLALVSQVQEATTQPAAAYLVIDETAIDAVTLNADLVAYASRDGGATWTAGTLEEAIDIGGGRRILTATINLTSHAAGTSMAYKIASANGKKVEINAVSEQWK